jgi:hypothetical protein
VRAYAIKSGGKYLTTEEAWTKNLHPSTQLFRSFAMAKKCLESGETVVKLKVTMEEEE